MGTNITGVASPEGDDSRSLHGLGSSSCNEDREIVGVTTSYLSS